MGSIHDRGAQRRRVRNWVVDGPWQISITLGLATLLILAAVLYGVSGLLAADLQSPWATAAQLLGIVGCVAALMVVVLRFTHRVSGPARVIEQALKDLRRGKLDPRLNLRERDYLQGIAHSLTRLAGQMRRERRRRWMLFHWLGECLENGDVESARRMLERLRRRSEGLGEESKAAEPLDLEQASSAEK